MTDFIKMKNLESFSFEELQIKLDQCKKELFRIRFNKTVKTLDDTSVLKKYKKNIARFYTKIEQIKNSNI